MKRFIITLLALCSTGVTRAELPQDFPTNQVNNYENLKAWFTDAPHTTAQFEMERTMLSGRVLKSRGFFEYRRGQGMMWRSDYPVRNALVITTEALKVYDAKGRELRTVSLQGSGAARFTSAFSQEMTSAQLKQLEKAFVITTMADPERNRLLVGMKARHSANDLRWMLLVVQNKSLHQVNYESSRQGLTKVVFSKVRHASCVPQGQFPLVP